MKQAFFIMVVAGALYSCNNSDKASTNSSDETKVAAASEEKPMDYAYTIEKPDQWVTGSRENTKMVLASLKKWETGDMAGAIEAFSDTVKLQFDHFEATVPRDSVRIIFENERKQMKGVQIIMDDFESVKSKDGTQEYVSLWYKQKLQDQKGKWDSIEVMDDLKIVNGKIASINEKTRHFAQKKM